MRFGVLALVVFCRPIRGDSKFDSSKGIANKSSSYSLVLAPLTFHGDAVSIHPGPSNYKLFSLTWFCATEDLSENYTLPDF